MRISVLGAGGWGTTLAILLSQNSHEVTLWSYLEEDAERIRTTRENPGYLPGISVPPDVAVTSNLLSAVSGAAMIVSAIPSQYVRGVVGQLKDHPFENVIVVNVAKGIENGTLMTMSEMLRDALPHLPLANIVTLSGPSHAEEVSRRVQTTVVAASVDPAAAQTAQAAFMVHYFRVYANSDLRGVELGGSLKNVIAIAAGIVDGADMGDNTKAALMTRGIAEITRLGVALGAQVRTFGGLSGIGDLIVTCMSRHSRNRYVGLEIGRGKKLAEILKSMVMVAEGVATTKSAYELAQRTGVEVPIINEVYKVLFEDKDPRKAGYDLMTRDPKEEHWT